MADVSITGAGAASSVNGTDHIPVTQSGVKKYATPAQIATFLGFSSSVLSASKGGAGTTSGILKANGAGTVSAASSGSDYSPATSGTSILKGDGSGAFANAVSGTDYAPATSGSSILKGNGGGGFASALAGTDYVAPGGALGTPSSGVATNLTGTASGLTAGAVSTINGCISAGSGIAVTGSGTAGSPYNISSTYSAPTTDLGYSQTTTVVNLTSSTGAGTSLPGATASAAGVMTAAQASNLANLSSGFLGVNSQSANYTFVSSDAGKVVLHPASDNSVRTFSLDTVANSGWTGTPSIKIRNQSASAVTIAPLSGVTLTRSDGFTGTGQRTVNPYSAATLTMDLGTNSWSIEGGSLS